MRKDKLLFLFPIHAPQTSIIINSVEKVVQMCSWKPPFQGLTYTICTHANAVSVFIIYFICVSNFSTYVIHIQNRAFNSCICRVILSGNFCFWKMAKKKKKKNDHFILFSPFLTIWTGTLSKMSGRFKIIPMNWVGSRYGPTPLVTTKLCKFSPFGLYLPLGPFFFTNLDT